MLLQDFQTIGVNLNLPLHLHTGAFKAKIEAANASE